MKGTYKRELNSSYLILEEQAMTSEQYYQLKMVTENTPKHLLKVSIHNFNGEKQFYYDISGKQTIACLFEKREMEADQLISVLSGLSEAIQELENYFLEENYLCLNPEYMYINVNTKQLYLCFYPCEEEEFFIGIRQLAEYLLNCINHQDERAVAAAYQFYRFTREDNFSFGQIVEEIVGEFEAAKNTRETEFSRENQDFPNNRPGEVGSSFYEGAYEDELSYDESEALEEEVQSVSIKEFKIPIICFLILIVSGTGYILYQYFTQNQTTPFSIETFFGTRDMILAAGVVLVGIVGFLLLFIYKKILAKERDTEENPQETIKQQMEREYFERSSKAYEMDEKRFEDDIYDEDEKYGETVLLKENVYKEEGILIEKLKRFDKKQPMKIVLDGFPFVIGKLEGVADYVISDKSVSRVHAKFMKNEKEDMVYLMDLNSKNGTLKNGIPLEVNEPVPLTAEDEITFGKVTFTYH